MCFLGLLFSPLSHNGTTTTTVIGESFGVLSDPEKRRRYDLIGLEGTSSLKAGKKGKDPMPDISPEDLFELFFNGRPPKGSAAHSKCCYRFFIFSS